MDEATRLAIKLSQEQEQIDKQNRGKVPETPEKFEAMAMDTKGFAHFMKSMDGDGGG